MRWRRGDSGDGDACLVRIIRYSDGKHDEQGHRNTDTRPGGDADACSRNDSCRYRRRAERRCVDGLSGMHACKLRGRRGVHDVRCELVRTRRLRAMPAHGKA